MNDRILRFFIADLAFQELLLNLESLDLPNMVWELASLMCEAQFLQSVFCKRFDFLPV